MPNSIYRKKLLNAVLFFAKNNKRLNLTKLAKLLYFFDFDHFKKTGYPSIGLQYYTFEHGPVPKDFWVEIKDCEVPEDFKGKLAITLIEDEYSNRKEILIRAITDPDLSVFSPRELKILENLAFIYKDATASQMSEISHLKKQPWDTTKRKKGMNELIDYLLCLDEKADISYEEAEENLREHFENSKNFGIEPVKPS